MHMWQTVFGVNPVLPTAFVQNGAATLQQQYLLCCQQTVRLSATTSIWFQSKSELQEVSKLGLELRLWAPRFRQIATYCPIAWPHLRTRWICVKW